MSKLITGVLLFDGVEELDYAGPYEVFSVANRMCNDLKQPEPFDLITIGEHDGIIKSAGGLKVIPDASIAADPRADILVVPGGAGTRRGSDIQPVIDYIKYAAEGALLVTSVCTGSFLLARAGLLCGLRATTHWASIARFSEQFPEIKVTEGIRVVDEGKIVTAGGISSGIDLALHLVTRLVSREISDKTAKRMEWCRK